MHSPGIKESLHLWQQFWGMDVVAVTMFAVANGMRY